MSETKPIEVRIKVDEIPLGNPKVYFDFVESKLREAGVPISNGHLESGDLRRFDMPENFGVTIWRWEPE